MFNFITCFGEYIRIINVFFILTLVGISYRVDITNLPDTSFLSFGWWPDLFVVKILFPDLLNDSLTVIILMRFRDLESFNPLIIIESSESSERSMSSLFISWIKLKEGLLVWPTTCYILHLLLSSLLILIFEILNRFDILLLILISCEISSLLSFWTQDISFL